MAYYGSSRRSTRVLTILTVGGLAVYSLAALYSCREFNRDQDEQDPAAIANGSPGTTSSHSGGHSFWGGHSSLGAGGHSSGTVRGGFGGTGHSVGS